MKYQKEREQYDNLLIKKPERTDSFRTDENMSMHTSPEKDLHRTLTNENFAKVARTMTVRFH